MIVIRTIVTCLWLLIYMHALAIPANSVPIIFRQPDGSFLTLILKGDEHFHCYVTVDNVPVIESEGSYYYATIDESGNISSTNILAHNSSQRCNEEIQFCNNLKEKFWFLVHKDWQSLIECANERRKSKRDSQKEGADGTFRGNKKGLVILVEFANLDMTTDNAQEVFNNQFNQTGYSENGHIGSVHDYFYDQSYGTFILTFDVIGPLRVSRNYGYYGANNGRGSDKYPGTMISEACNLADQFVDFAEYDWNHDGEVDQIYVIYAGHGESSSGTPSNTIWPHEYNLTACQKSGDGNGPLTLDGVTIDTYACSCELRGAYGNEINGIGTACHEFSHCLGFPDLYDTGYNGGFGMNCWDLMDSGSYCGPDGCGEVPCGYSAYEREVAGWLKPIELTAPTVIENMACIADEPVAYRICNDHNRDEYFLLENRQNKGWFTYAKNYQSAHGMLITHVDYNATAWAINKVNTNKTHQRMSIVPADNSYGTTYKSDDGQVYFITSEQDLAGDLFPGCKGITEFTNTSHLQTGGLLFNVNTDGSYYLNKPVENIREENGMISFYFMGGMYIESPNIQTIADIGTSAFSVSWNAVGNADTYTLELTEATNDNNPLKNVLLNENFYKFKTAGSYDGFTDLSEELDAYTILSGWGGYKVFSSPKGVKIGTSNASGYIVTPKFPVNGGNITMMIPASSYESESVMLIELTNESGITVFSENHNLTSKTDSIYINISHLSVGTYNLKISSTARFYICGINIYSGNYTQEDLEDFDNYLKPADKRIIENIHETHYTFTELTAKMYKLRIQARNGLAHSEWSQPQEIVLSTADGMSFPNINQTGQQKIYYLNGMSACGQSTKGVYIITDGKNTKKIIR